MYLHTQFQTLRSGCSLVLAVKRQEKRTFREVAYVILYSQAHAGRMREEFWTAYDTRVVVGFRIYLTVLWIYVQNPWIKTALELIT
jgi:hypothetical protein